jgi:phage/plasmid primase-like uncharacterized protein
MAHNWGAIKAMNPIADIVGARIKLIKKGSEYEGLCPFHGEKTPSFTVNDAKGFYHCFGCGAHGDVIDFLAAYEKIDTSAALAILSGGADIKLTPQDQAEYKRALGEREAASRAAQKAASADAERRWEAAPLAGDNHPYLTRKVIPAHTARLCGNRLLLPVYDAQGDILSVQTIPPDKSGRKLFHPGAPTKGGRMMIGLNFNLGRTIICEGFATGASIYDAMPEQVCVAYSKANIANVARELAAAGRPIIIASDRNALTDMTKLGAELDCPVIAPPAAAGDDFNDMAVNAAYGPAAVAKCFADGIRGFVSAGEAHAAQAAADNDPVDLWARIGAPALPHGLLPDIIERFARTMAEQMGVDTGGLAMSALAACAAVIRDTIKIKVKRHENWHESARLWVMLVGKPSFKKSPIMRVSAGKIRSIDSAMLRANNAALNKWQEEGGKKDGGPMPAQPRLRVSDITMESAQEICKHSPHGILALQDELSGWFGSLEKYSGGKGGAKDRSFWLSAYNGEEYAVDRIGRGSFIIDNLSISILGGVQPDPIRKLLKGDSDDGLIQRFLPVILREASIERDIAKPAIESEYDGLVECLHDLEPPESFMGRLPLQFSDDAMEIRQALVKENWDNVLAFEKINSKLSSHFGKYDGLFPRLCVIWHCIEHCERVCAGPVCDVTGSGDGIPVSSALPVEISADVALRVARFMREYITKHSMAFYQDVTGLSTDQDALEDIAGYILARGLDKVNMRTLQRGSSGMRAMGREDGRRLFEQLEYFGWLEQKSKYGEAPQWAVNPRAHELFATKADSERDRRGAIMQAIKEKAVGKA